MPLGLTAPNPVMTTRFIQSSSVYQFAGMSDAM